MSEQRFGPFPIDPGASASDGEAAPTPGPSNVVSAILADPQKIAAARSAFFEILGHKDERAHATDPVVLLADVREQLARWPRCATAEFDEIWFAEDIQLLTDVAEKLLVAHKAFSATLRLVSARADGLDAAAAAYSPPEKPEVQSAGRVSSAALLSETKTILAAVAELGIKTGLLRPTACEDLSVENAVLTLQTLGQQWQAMKGGLETMADRCEALRQDVSRMLPVVNAALAVATAEQTNDETVVGLRLHLVEVCEDYSPLSRSEDE